LGNQPIDKPKPPENMLDGYPIKFWQQACVIIGDRGNKFMNMRHNLINPDLLDAVMEYFKNQSESKTNYLGFIIHAYTQVGKTHLLFALIVHYLHHGKAVKYWNATDLMGSLILFEANARNSNMLEREKDALYIDKYLSADVIFIDDLNICPDGQLISTPKLHAFGKLFDKLLTPNRRIFLTSNNTVGDFDRLECHVDVSKINARIKVNLKRIDLDLPIWSEK